MTEYATVVNTIQLQPGIADATSDEVSQSLGTNFGDICGKLSKGLPNFQGGGWTVVSHSLTRIDHHLIVTFLLSRDK